MDLQEVRSSAVHIAREAGAVLLHYFDHPHHEDTKQTAVDIVTEADKASEAVIAPALQAAFPSHHIIGEEGGGMGAPANLAEYFWYVDPLDGTTNYANNLPIFAVSIALAGRDMRPLVGVVYNPVTNELFTAVRGGGATLNDKPLYVSSRGSLNTAILASGFPYDKATNPDNNLRQWGNMLVRVRGMRRLGSAAIDLCYVAAGRFEGYWERRLNPWDCLAGLLCLQEAGGKATDFSGQESDLLYTGREVVASNGLLHDEILEVLRL